MRTFDLARKDWLQIFRDKRSLLFLVLMPVLFTFFFGFVMGGSGGDGPIDTRLPVGIIDLDGQGAAGQAFNALLAASDTVRPVEVKVDEQDTVDENVRSGKLAAVVTIPAGYNSALFAGETISLDLVVDGQSQAGMTANRAVQTAVNRLLSSMHMALYNALTYGETAGFADEAARHAYEEEALKRSVDGWANPMAAVRMTGPVVEGEPEGGKTNPYTQFSPGMMVMFAVFGLSQVAMVLVFERNNGALSRLVSTPIRRWELIGGHILAMFGVIFLQQLLLAAFGQAFLGVQYLREPLASLLMIASLSLLIAAMGLLIGALAKGEQQVTLWSMITMFVMSALGGTWFPLEVSGKAFAAVGHLMPTAWAMDGLQNIIIRGLGFGSVLLPAGIILAYALAFFGLAIWKFKFE